MKMSTKPTLTTEAENKIAEQYSRWRIDKAEGMRSRRALPVTARTLETIRQERSKNELSSFRHITTAFSVLVVVFTSFVSTTTHFTPFTMPYHYSYSYYYHHHQQQHRGCSNCRFQSNQQLGSNLKFISKSPQN